MKLKLMIIGLIIVSMVTVVVAQQSPAPEPKDIATLNKVSQEHQNTRKFFSDELSRQRNEFFNQMDSRFDYYERTFDNFMTLTAFKLGLMWGGIVLLSIGAYSLFRVRLDKKKNKRFNDSVAQLIRTEVNSAMTQFANTKDIAKPKDPVRQEQNQQFAKGMNIKRPVLQNQKPFPEIEIERRQTQQAPMPQQQAPMPQQQKKGFFERRKEKKAMKKLAKLEKQQQFINQQKAKAMGNIYQQPQPQPQQNQQQQIKREEQNGASYSYEVNI